MNNNRYHAYEILEISMWTEKKTLENYADEDQNRELFIYNNIL